MLFIILICRGETTLFFNFFNDIGAQLGIVAEMKFQAPSVFASGELFYPAVSIIPRRELKTTRILFIFFCYEQYKWGSNEDRWT